MWTLRGLEVIWEMSVDIEYRLFNLVFTHIDLLQ
jgi:hypothetical protein